MTTLSEIAKKANVSIGTVDRVIHNRGRVSEATKRRIQKIIRDTEYRPNVMARNLSLKKTFTFGALIPKPEQDGHYWELPASGIRRALDELRLYNVDVVFYTYDKYSDASFTQACRSVQRDLTDLDGLLIAPVLSKAAEGFIEDIPESLPYIFIDSYLPNVQSISFIGQESYKSGMLAGQLMKMKCAEGKIAITRMLPLDYHIEDRVRGFHDSLHENHTLYQYDINREHDNQSFYDLTEKILQDHPGINEVGS